MSPLWNEPAYRVVSVASVRSWDTLWISSTIGTWYVPFQAVAPPSRLTALAFARIFFLLPGQNYSLITETGFPKISSTCCCSSISSRLVYAAVQFHEVTQTLQGFLYFFSKTSLIAVRNCQVVTVIITTRIGSDINLLQFRSFIE